MCFKFCHQFPETSWNERKKSFYRKSCRKYSTSNHVSSTLPLTLPQYPTPNHTAHALPLTMPQIPCRRLVRSNWILNPNARYFFFLDWYGVVLVWCPPPPIFWQQISCHKSLPALCHLNSKLFYSFCFVLLCSTIHYFLFVSPSIWWSGSEYNTHICAYT